MDCTFADSDACFALFAIYMCYVQCVTSAFSKPPCQRGWHNSSLDCKASWHLRGCLGCLAATLACKFGLRLDYRSIIVLCAGAGYRAFRPQLWCTSIISR